jgi:hypothetical protein
MSAKVRTLKAARWSGPDGKRCRSTVAIETEFFSALDLNDARIMDDDFDRSVTKSFKGRNDVVTPWSLTSDLGTGDGLTRFMFNLYYSDDV